MEVQLLLTPTQNLASALKGRDRKYEEWKQYTDVLNPRVVRPDSEFLSPVFPNSAGTPEELIEAKQMSMMWKRRLMVTITHLDLVTLLATRKNFQERRAIAYKIENVGNGTSARPPSG